MAGQNGFSRGICTSFTIRKTQVTDAGVKNFQQALPNLWLGYELPSRRTPDHRPPQPVQAPPPLVSIQPADAVGSGDGALCLAGGDGESGQKAAGGGGGD